jgi:hypothetical protein
MQFIKRCLNDYKLSRTKSLFLPLSLSRRRRRVEWLEYFSGSGDFVLYWMELELNAFLFEVAAALILKQLGLPSQSQLYYFLQDLLKTNAHLILSI